MTRFAITHVSPKTNLRTLTFANQARNFYDSKEEAEQSMRTYKPDLQAKILGDAANTLEVRPVECYENGDAKSIYLD